MSMMVNSLAIAASKRRARISYGQESVQDRLFRRAELPARWSLVVLSLDSELKWALRLLLFDARG